MTHAGITGHQRLEGPQVWRWVTDVIHDELERMTPPLIAVSSLAIGADQLLARLVIERGGSLHAVLPFAGIERSFAPADLPAYRELLRYGTVEVLNTSGTDEDAYLRAGKRVVDLSDIVLAVWNGNAARGKGGTADVVAYALECRVPLIHINTTSHTVQRLT